jgi:tRNA dimethylallyltransferase
MLAGGLLAEAAALEALAAAGGRRPTSLQAIGYPEALAVLRGEIDPEEAASLIATNTRRYAKRQATWLRAEPNALVVRTPAEAAAALEARIRPWLGPLP